MARRWTFTPAQWGLLTRIVQIEDYPSPINVELAAGGTDEAARELHSAGLLAQGRVDPDLAEMLDVLVRCHSSVDAVWGTGTEPQSLTRVLAARAGMLGVIATQTPDQPGATHLAEIATNALPSAVARQLPPAPAGRAEAVTVTAGQAGTSQPGTGGNSVLASHSSALSRGERDRRAALRIVDTAHDRSGQIGATGRDGGGRRRRSDLLRWFDNPGDGRYVVLAQRNRSGNALRITPADADALGTHAAELLSTVAS